MVSAALICGVLSTPDRADAAFRNAASEHFQRLSRVAHWPHRASSAIIDGFSARDSFLLPLRALPDFSFKEFPHEQDDCCDRR
jgi:hypothetical protein